MPSTYSITGARIDKACAECGSTELQVRAWAEWSPTEQRWVLESLDEDAVAWCVECECETTIQDIDATTGEPA